MATAVSSTNSGPLLTSAGLGSGLDVKTIIAAMVNAESQPINELQKQAAAMKTKLSAFGSVKSYLATFRDAASALARPQAWNATASASSNAAAVAVSSDTGAATGAYSVTVSQLASAQTLSSRVFASGAAVGGGTLTIARTGVGGASARIDVDATDTLAQVRDKINAANTGATAHIQTDATGSRLVLQSSETGAANGFSVSAVDDDGVDTDGAGLSALSFDPAATTNPMTQQQPGADALARINGVDVRSASNVLANVLDGITLTLGAVTTTAASVTVTQDTASIKTAITSMVSAYNALQTYLGSQTKYDAGSKTGATLQGDSTTNGIRNQLRGLMGGTSGASATFTRLSQVGFDLQKDGSIVLNQAKLSSALANPAELRKLFADSDPAAPANEGFAVQLRRAGDAILGTDGALTSRTKGIQSSIDYNGKRQADMQLRIDKYQARVEAQYTALDTKMSSLNSLSTYVTQQITQMNKSTS